MECSQLLIEETFSTYSNVINNAINHDVAKWHLRQSLNPNFDLYSRVQVSVKWTSAFCIPLHSSLLQMGCISLSFLRVPSEHPLVSFSVRAYSRPPVQLYSMSTGGFSSRVSTHGMWWAHFPFSFVLPFPPRTRNYSSLSYFLSSFHSFPPVFFVILS